MKNNHNEGENCDETSIENVMALFTKLPTEYKQKVIDAMKTLLSSEEQAAYAPRKDFDIVQTFPRQAGPCS